MKTELRLEARGRCSGEYVDVECVLEKKKEQYQLLANSPTKA